MNHEEIQYYGSEAGYQARWDGVTTAQSNLQAEILEAEVLWGASARATFEPLYKLQHELFGAIYLYLLSMDPKLSEQSRRSLSESLAKKREFVFDLAGPEPDVFAVDLSLTVSKIEEFVKPHLEQ